MKKAKFYTMDQNLRYLIDDALFSDSQSARIGAIKELARDYGRGAVPVIEEIIKTLPTSDEEFIMLCKNVIAKIREKDHYTKIYEE